MSTHSSTMMSSPSRRSTRKRRAPVRYGLDKETKRRRRLTILELPEDILRKSLGFLSTVSDRFSLQTTNKLFRNLSNEAAMTQNMQLLVPSSEEDEDTATLCSSEADEDTTLWSIIQEEDTSEMVMKRLLPFAQQSNKDALFLMGLQALFVEDDVHVGLRLLQKGMEEGDLRCKHEIGNFLSFSQDTAARAAGKRHLEEAAAEGHAASVISIQYGHRSKNERVKLCVKAGEEMDRTACLRHLTSKKLYRPHATSFACENPSCFRQFYNLEQKAVRKWFKRRWKPYSAQWRDHRRALLSCGACFPHRRQGGKRFYYIPPFQTCSRCLNADYCSNRCQILHWRGGHSVVCAAPPQQNDG